VTLQVQFLGEPKLSFNAGGMSIDPKLGLARFGPYSRSGDGAQDISVGVIGPERETGELLKWIERCQHPIEGKPGKLHLDPHFPGLERAFGSRFSVSRNWELIFSRFELQTRLADSDPIRRFERTVNLYLERVSAAAESQPYPQVILLALSQELLDHCSAVHSRQPVIAGERSTTALPQTKVGQLAFSFVEEDLDAIEETAATKDVYRNFRRAIKVGVMQSGIPIQLATPRLWQDRADAQHPATKAWNFCTGMYFKAGGVPWMWAGMPADTCYVGVSFYRPETERGSVRTALAQVFTSRGEGMVIRGQRFELEEAYSAPHMPRNLAADLMQKAIGSYTTVNNGVPPRRLVVHKTSRYWSDELEGLQSAASSVPFQTYVTLDERDVHFVRYMKDYPPARGTLCTMEGVQESFLFTRGSITIRRTYPGPYVPKPLVIVEHVGDSPLEHIAHEIMGLSKLNWNAALLANFHPITLQFANRVGNILSAAGPNDPVASQFRFYM
jgi:hypothetical protein